MAHKTTRTRRPRQTAKEVIDGVLGVDPRGDHPSVKRSSKWPKVMHEHLKREPCCQVCGHTRGLNVHHEIPYHLKPELELVDSNLITLCTNLNGGHDCHLLFGHLGDFKGYDPFVRDLAGLIRKMMAIDKAALKLIHGKAKKGKRCR